jgi:hypothetical protein
MIDARKSAEAVRGFLDDALRQVEDELRRAIPAESASESATQA